MRVRKTEDKVVADFKKAFSCSYSVTRNLGEALGLEADDLLLRAVVGFGAGVSTMGDTCGAINSGFLLFGKRFPHSSEDIIHRIVKMPARRNTCFGFT